HTVADEIIDVWRSEADPFVHAWEDRFIVDHGYRANVREVVRGLFAKTGLGPKDFAKLVLYGPDARSHAALVRELGFEPAQAEDALFGKVGNAGTAFAPLLLAAALEGARAGQRILLVGYGAGAGSPSPPLVATVVDVEGARLYLQMTDASPKEVQLDLPVELVFRKMHDAGGTPNYYWKCTPVR